MTENELIEEQRAVIAELNAAHDAQNAVLARMQAELVEARAWFADIQREFEKELATVRAERDAALSQITFLNKVIERLQAPRQ